MGKGGSGNCSALRYQQGRFVDRRRERTEDHPVRTQLGGFAVASLRQGTATTRNPGGAYYPSRQREEVQTGRSHSSRQRRESGEFLSKKRFHTRATTHCCG